MLSDLEKYIELKSSIANDLEKAKEDEFLMMIELLKHISFIFNNILSSETFSAEQNVKKLSSYIDTLEKIHERRMDSLKQFKGLIDAAESIKKE